MHAAYQISLVEAIRLLGLSDERPPVTGRIQCPGCKAYVPDYYLISKPTGQPVGCFDCIPPTGKWARRITFP
jgi:hypothetical protein